MASWEPVDNDPTDRDEIEEENDKWDDNLMDKLEERFNNIKIMPYVEGDRSDCQPEASSIARSRRLRAVVVVEG